MVNLWIEGYTRRCFLVCNRSIPGCLVAWLRSLARGRLSRCPEGRGAWQAVFVAATGDRRQWRQDTPPGGGWLLLWLLMMGLLPRKFPTPVPVSGFPGFRSLIPRTVSGSSRFRTRTRSRQQFPEISILPNIISGIIISINRKDVTDP